MTFPSSPIAIHIVQDEKFIDAAFERYETAWPGRNEFLIIGAPRELRYIRKCPVRFTTIPDVILHLRTLKRVALILHSLSGGSHSLLAQVPDHVCVVWIGWGFDYYGKILGGSDSADRLMEETRALAATRPTRFNWRVFLETVFARLIKLDLPTWRRIRAIAQPLQYKQELAREKRRALGRIDYFIPVLKSEYDRALAENDWFRPSHFAWSSYGRMTDLGGANTEPAFLSEGTDILVGNSATLTNNHLEVFSLLERLDLGGTSRIVCPLSYGGDPWYKEKILIEGERRFGNRFRPLTEFLDSDSYLEILSSVKVAFMNHRRQQALGNINLLLEIGRRVYMNADSLLFDELKRRGHVIEEIPWHTEKGSARALDPLPIEDRRLNREIILARRTGLPDPSQVQLFADAIFNGRPKRAAHLIRNTDASIEN